MGRHAEPGTRRLVVTCEHGGNRVPKRYRVLFRGFNALLHTHRGYDPGALAMARVTARALSAPLLVSTTSRLLIDLNRSIGHPRLYSEVTRCAPAAVRREILERHYLPYRNRAEALIGGIIACGNRVIHVSMHSFTPELDGVERNADVGLLYDPKRHCEAQLCARWRAALTKRDQALKVRRNYPYAGKSDGLTAYLRRRFPSDFYIGIELEINQRHVSGGRRRWQELQRLVISSLQDGIVNLLP